MGRTLGDAATEIHYVAGNGVRVTFAQKSL